MKDWLDWSMVQGDTGPALPATLREADGSPAQLHGASSVEFVMKAEAADEPRVVGEMEVINASLGEVRYNWAPGDTDKAGYFLAHVKVTRADGSVSTYPGTKYWEIQIRESL